MVLGRSQPVVQAISPRLVTIAHVGLKESVHALDAVEWLLQTSLGSWSVLGRLLQAGQGRCNCSSSTDVSQHPILLGTTQPCLGLRAFSDAQLQDESSWIHQLAASLAPAFRSVGSKSSSGVGVKMERLHRSRIPPSIPFMAPAHAACRDAELMVFM